MRIVSFYVRVRYRHFSNQINPAFVFSIQEECLEHALVFVKGATFFERLCVGADVSVKRRKMDDSEDDEDSESEGRVGRKRAAESSPLPERRPVDLLVLGVCYKTTDEAFKAYFETFGPVVFAEVRLYKI